MRSLTTTDAAGSDAADTAPRGRRLKADARRSSILEAARHAFTEAGDVNGTTIRRIAERAGISEGVIYRHFESKDQLFLEAVVEPLTAEVDRLVAAAHVVDRDEPLTPERQAAAMSGLYRRLTATLEEVLPLLGLVLFGDPVVAQRFYTETLTVAMDRLAEAWREVQERYGAPAAAPDVSARAVMGIALVLAMEARNTEGFDRDRAVRLASAGTIDGFFSAIDPTSPAGRRRPPAG